MKKFAFSTGKSLCLMLAATLGSSVSAFAQYIAPLPVVVGYPPNHSDFPTLQDIVVDPTQAAARAALGAFRTRYLQSLIRAAATNHAIHLGSDITPEGFVCALRTDLPRVEDQVAYQCAVPRSSLSYTAVIPTHRLLFTGGLELNGGTNEFATNARISTSPATSERILQRRTIPATQSTARLIEELHERTMRLGTLWDNSGNTLFEALSRETFFVTYNSAGFGYD